MVFTVRRVGSFPHQMYVARCSCVDGQEQKTTNDVGHVTGPPKCSTCRRSYELDEQLAQQPLRRSP